MFVIYPNNQTSNLKEKTSGIQIAIHLFVGEGELLFLRLADLQCRGFQHQLSKDQLRYWASCQSSDKKLCVWCVFFVQVAVFFHIFLFMLILMILF